MRARDASSIVWVSMLFACSAAPVDRLVWPAGAQPEGRVFSSLLRVFEAAEWDKVFVKMARVVVNYFTDMAFKVLFGSTGSRRSSGDGDLESLRAGRERRDIAQYVLESQQRVSQLPPRLPAAHRLHGGTTHGQPKQPAHAGADAQNRGPLLG
ncbi:hypothetical protein MRX96_022316 [Rhipicephalus microplus]